jgi:hypothetical protein
MVRLLAATLFALALLLIALELHQQAKRSLLPAPATSEQSAWQPATGGIDFRAMEE